VGRHYVLAARASSGGLQETLDASDIIGRWEWDIVQGRIYAGAAVAFLFNVPPALARAGAPLSDYLKAVHPEDREKTTRSIIASSRDGRTYVQEYRVRSADGVTRYILARGRIQRDETGRPHWGSGLLIDITPNRLDPDETSDRGAETEHPLPLAAEHCLAMRNALYELPEPLLRRMSDMLLLEIGRAMVRAESAGQRSQMN